MSGIKKLMPLVALAAVGVAMVTGMDYAGDLTNITQFITFVSTNFVAILALFTSSSLLLLLIALKFYRQIINIGLYIIGRLGGSGGKA